MNSAQSFCVTTMIFQSYICICIRAVNREREREYTIKFMALFKREKKIMSCIGSMCMCAFTVIRVLSERIYALRFAAMKLKLYIQPGVRSSFLRLQGRRKMRSTITVH